MTAPVVSIGLPVYNGASLMRRAIDSVLKQDFTDFELIICDNASTDGTSEVAAEYVVADPRVRYVRRESTRGALDNFEHALSLARGEMFGWISHDDTYERPNHLGRLVAKIREGNALAFPEARPQYIDEQGNVIRTGQDMLAGFGEIRTRRELVRLAMRRASVQIFGLFRIDKLREHIPLLMANRDMHCFHESSFIHKFLMDERWAFVPEALINIGQHAANVSRTQDPSTLLRAFLLYSARVLKMNRKGAHFTGSEKLIVYSEIARQAPYATRLFASVVRRRLRGGDAAHAKH